MATTTETQPALKTMADLLVRLGGISADRVWLEPPPGTATEQDVLVAERRENRLCELVEGVLVEKAMGYRESLLAGLLLTLIRGFVDPRNLGLVTGPDGMMRLFPGLVRIPDVAFVSWERLPDGKVPEVPMPDLAPDLAVELLSRSNTPGEMHRKRKEYFAAGVRLVWEIDPSKRSVSVYRSRDQVEKLKANETLEGGSVLPGFSLSLATLFAELDRTADAGTSSPD